MAESGRPLEWVRASGCAESTCVEVAATDAGVAVRDSKDPTAGPLYFTRDEWTEFASALRRGEFDALSRG